MIVHTLEVKDSQHSTSSYLKISRQRASTQDAASDSRTTGELSEDEQIQISIVVPVYQEEKILASTLSLFSEELRAEFKLELIVSDGGSTDRTLEIAEQYADKIVQHLDTKRQTIAGGRNAGALVAEGDILVFLNGDTVPTDIRRFLQTVRVWSSHNKVSGEVAVACPVHVAPQERQLRDTLFHGFFNSYVRMLNLVGLGMGRGECQIVRSWAFKLVGGYNAGISAGEDFDLFRRLARIGKIGHKRGTGVYESPRRFRKYGYGRVLWSWFLNAISVMIRKKSVSEEWEAVR